MGILGGLTMVNIGASRNPPKCQALHSDIQVDLTLEIWVDLTWEIYFKLIHPNVLLVCMDSYCCPRGK